MVAAAQQQLECFGAGYLGSWPLHHGRKTPLQDGKTEEALVRLITQPHDSSEEGSDEASEEASEEVSKTDEKHCGGASSKYTHTLLTNSGVSSERWRSRW